MLPGGKKLYLISQQLTQSYYRPQRPLLFWFSLQIVEKLVALRRTLVQIVMQCWSSVQKQCILLTF